MLRQELQRAQGGQGFAQQPQQGGAGAEIDDPTLICVQGHPLEAQAAAGGADESITVEETAEELAREEARPAQTPRPALCDVHS